MDADALPRSVEDVFKDFKGRRSAMLKALTSEVDEFFLQCDPEKENLCLYGFPDEVWEVNLPAEEVPPELPEPAVGINFSRDRNDWLSLVAIHSDAWLLAVAFFFGARFDKTERKQLFYLINDLPTLHDVVTGKNLVKEKPTKSKPSSAVKLQRSGKAQQELTRPPPPPREEDGANEDDHEDTLCGICLENYAQDEFWICCDVCETWFHGKCVKMTPAKAEHIGEYKCPACNNKKARI